MLYFCQDLFPLKERTEEGRGRKLKKLSVTEVSMLVGKSARHIRNLCKEGKLPCQKIKISTGTKYLIYSDTEELKRLIGDNRPDEHDDEIPVYEGSVEGIEEGINSGWQEVITEMAGKIEALAREAGKAELLTDNLITTKQDVKFYQDEYFKIRHELETTKATLNQYIKENEELRKEVDSLNEKLKKSSWWKFKIK